jgi:hypothetical protein
LPAVSVDESYGLDDSWRQTRGQGWRMFVTMMLTVFPLWLVLSIVLNLPFTEITETFAFYLLTIVLRYIDLGLYVTLVSISFRICSGWTPCAPSQVADPGASGPGQQ